MTRKSIFLVLSLIGLVAPYYFFFKFLGENGFDIPLLVGQLFSTNISTFFAVDLVVSIIVFWVYMLAEANKLQMKNWWLYILASLTVGLSFALPLFLYFRERKLENK
jgi:phosphoglycerol transferase MdoB-like AlkP superfamily enzyme